MSQEKEMPPRTEPRGGTALITVTYNSAAVLPAFLASLSAQAGDGWALIAIDNASSDDSAARIESWRGPLHALVRNDENIGFARASNQGIRIAMEAGFDSVLLINNDTEFGPDFLQLLLESPHRQAAPILVPVVQDAASGGYWYAGGRFRMRGGLEVVMDKAPPDDASEAWPAGFAPACCKLIDVDVFRRIGLFDEQFFVYWEDADFCLRCRDAGIPILVVRNPMLAHHASSLTGGALSPFFIDQYHRNQIKLIRKRYGRASLALQMMLVAAKIAVRRLLGRDRSSVSRARLRAVRAELSGGAAARQGKNR
jgi:GT2 family glycosyltransferase